VTFSQGFDQLDIPFQALVEQVPGMTYVCAYDEEGTLLYLSPQVEEVTGYPPEYFVGHPERWRDILHPDDRDWVVEKIAEDVRAERPFDAEYRIVRADGHTRTLWDREALVRGADGRPVYSHGVVVDLTEQRAAEAALRARDEWHRSVLSALDEGLVVFDAEGLAVACNDSFTRMLSLPADEIIGRRPPPVSTPVVATLRSGEPVRGLALEVRRPDGRGIWISANYQPLVQHGERAGVVCSISDVTQARQAEEDLRRRLEQQEIVGALGRRVIEGVALTDLAAAAASGIARGLGARGVVISGGADRGSGPQIHAQWGRPDPGLKGALRMPVETAEGPFAEIAVQPAEERTLGREDRTFVGSVANVLAAAAAREEARHLEERLNRAQRLESVGQLAGGIAHDFNNLLTVIRGYSEFMLEALDDHPELQADLVEIRRAANRGAELTRQLLTFSRRTPPTVATVDLGSVVRETEGLLERALGEHIEVRSELHDGPCTTRADLGQIEQVLMNLAVNARDAMPDGGVVTVSTSRFERSSSSAGGPPVEPGPYVVLEVADTGTGMPREVVDRALEPFFTTKEEGTGLGLATVYGIATQCGGNVVVESMPGEGTGVSVYLPFAPPEDEPPHDPAAAVAPALSAHVLVVENDDAIRGLAARVLREAGHPVTTAANGDEALAAIAEEVPDLVLTDVVMPGLSGPSLVARVQQEHPELPVVYMSGYTGGAGEHRAMSPDVPFIAKPFSGEKLLATVAEALAAR
jgi:two-component system, cell cycle sensor histidine kinase and response regulator CckA